MQKSTLNQDAIERIFCLNSYLYDAAKWVEERARLTRNAYFAGGGRHGDEYTEEEAQHYGYEDYELEATVKCSLGSDHPAFSPDDEYGNMIAVCKDNLKQYRNEVGDTNSLLWSDIDLYNAPSDVKNVDRAQFCYLFHEVYEHALNNDLAALTRIGEIEIDLVLQRQRIINLETELLPRNLSSPRSVFGQSPLGHWCEFKHLSHEERDYARLLNQKMEEVSAWIEKQARRSEEEYRAIGGVDRQLSDSAYEDYEMILRVVGVIGKKHPEYDEEDDGIVTRYTAPIFKENQRIFGRGRNLFLHNNYGAFFPHGKRLTHDSNLWSVRQQELSSWYMPIGCDESNIIHSCGLFWNILHAVDTDWFKMLSINGLWVDVDFIQRRIIPINFQ